MKLKNFFKLSLFLVGFFGVSIAYASGPEEGLPEESDPFWGIMSQLTAPDDSDCTSLTATMLQNDHGMSVLDATTEATAACAEIAEIPNQMTSDMPEGESINTNLTSASNWHAVENLYFEHSTDGVIDGRIEFTQPIDFMSYDFMLFMQTFGERMDTNTAEISLDADIVDGLEGYGAILTMYNVPEFEDPTILVDGAVDENGVVSGLVYNGGNQTIAFNAAHFTSFEAVESSSVDTPNIKSVKTRKFLSSHGKERVRAVVYGGNFSSHVDIELGSKKPYNIRRDIEDGRDRVEAYFDLDELINLGHRKLTVHMINSGGGTTDYDDEVDLEDLKALKIWEYQKIYKGLSKRLTALSFVYNNNDYIRN